MSQELFLNDVLADLFVREPLRPTFQINDFGEVIDHQSNFTRQFAIPITPNNLKITGFAGGTVSASTIPQTRLSAKYVLNGVEIIPKGEAIVSRFTETQINLVIFSGTFNFFDAVGILNLTDLDLSVHDFVLDRTTVAGMANDKSPVAFPAVQYGTRTTISENLDIRFQRHATSISTIIDAIFSEQNTNKSGALFTDAFYLNLVLPSTNELYQATSAVLDNRFEARQESVDQILTVDSDVHIIEFNTEITDPNSNYDPTTFKYTAVEGWHGRIKVSVEVQNIDAGTALAGELRIVGADTSLVITYVTISINVPPSTTKVFEFQTPEDSLIDATQIVQADYKITSLGLSPLPKFLQANDLTFIKGTATRAAGVGTTVEVTANLPIMTQKELLKEVFGLFRVFLQFNETTNTMVATMFKDLVANIILGNVDDWSDLVDTSGRAVLGFSKAYAQVNDLKWAQDQGPIGLGDGSFSISNVNLSANRNILQTKLASSEIVIVGEDREQADLTIWTPGVLTKLNDSTQTEKIKPRLLYLSSTTDSVDIVDESASVNNVSDAFVGMFEADSGSPNSLDFDGAKGILTKFWAEFTAAAAKGRVLRLPLRLNEKLIKELDFARPKFIRTVIGDQEINGHFYVNRIPKYREDRSTQVELIEL